MTEPKHAIPAYGPHWSAYWGQRTGKYWAVPLWSGAPDVMVEADDMVELDKKMTAVEDKHPPPQ